MKTHEEIHVKCKKNLQSLGIVRPTIPMYLKVLGLIQKQGNWVSYELKPKDLERRFINNLSNGKNGKVFCIVSLLVIKNGYTTTIQSKKIMG